MSEKYKIDDDLNPNFVTFTVAGWVDVFTRNEYRNLIINSLKYCQKNKGLLIYAYCIMTNHLHLIVSSSGKTSLGNIFRDFRGFTSKELIKMIQTNPRESRKKWILQYFQKEGEKRISNKKYQLWKRNYHPVTLSSQYLFDQKLNYIHQNPVKAGFVFSPEDFVYSSASNYAGKIGLIDVIID